MKQGPLLTQPQKLLTGITGILGVVCLMVSFSINPAPPAGATIQQIITWGKQHEFLILSGAWLQGVGSLLEVIFIISLLYAGNRLKSISGWITGIAAAAIMTISLVEVSFYISAVNGGVSGNLILLSTSIELIKAIQHAYVIAPAPALLLGLGYVLYTSTFLHRFFSYVAILLGCLLAILGLIGTFTPMQQSIDTVLGIQEVWFFAVAVGVLLSKPEK